MSGLRISLALALLTLSPMGCEAPAPERITVEQCEPLARHIATFEADAAADSVVATLEKDCRTSPPTRKQYDCIMAAKTFDEFTAC